MINQFFDIVDGNDEQSSKIITSTFTNNGKEGKKSSIPPYEYVNNIYAGVKWESYSDEDRNNFSIFITNKFLSMVFDFIDIVAQLQHLTMNMPKEAAYKLYADLLQKPKYFSKYIKATATETKISDKLIDILQNHFKVSSREIYMYLDILSKDDVSNIIKKYGISKEETKKLLKY